MTQLTEFDLDDDGKIDLHPVYNRPDPRAYYQTLQRLDYWIPAAAEPLFRRVIDLFRETRRRRRATLVDVGSSYGVNAAILKHGFCLADLFRLYGGGATAGLPTRDLIARDRSLFNGEGDPDLVAIGLDAAPKAIAYASEAGILDAGLAVDFETRPPSQRESAQLAPADLIISTGAIGYVGGPTFSRILDAARRRPWFALFALRMFPFDEVATVLRARDYAILKLGGRTFRQRRFANRKERTEVIARLGALGIDPEGKESEGWLHAEFFLARPAEDAGYVPSAGLVAT